MIEIGFHAFRHCGQKLHEGGGLRKQAAGRGASVGAAQLGLEVTVEVPLSHPGRLYGLLTNKSG